MIYQDLMLHERSEQHTLVQHMQPKRSKLAQLNCEKKFYQHNSKMSPPRTFKGKSDSHTTMCAMTAGSLYRVKRLNYICVSAYIVVETTRSKESVAYPDIPKLQQTGTEQTD
ncbi:unnamed protein product [Amaranthus hypochondriacus]